MATQPPLENSKQTTQTIQAPSPLEPQLPELTGAYAQYFQFQTLNNRSLTQIHDTAEHHLTQLDELDQIVNSAHLNLEQTKNLMKPLLAQTKELQKTFALIDALDNWVGQVEKQVQVMQEQVHQAEQNSSQNELTQFFFKNLPLSKIVDAPNLMSGNLTTSNFVRAEIDTKEYFDQLRKDFK